MSSTTTSDERLSAKPEFKCVFSAFFANVLIEMSEEEPGTSSLDDLFVRPIRQTAEISRIIIDSCMREDSESGDESVTGASEEFERSEFVELDSTSKN